jgi:hypothetical protein
MFLSLVKMIAPRTELHVRKTRVLDVIQQLMAANAKGFQAGELSSAIRGEAVIEAEP